VRVNDLYFQNFRVNLPKTLVMVLYFPSDLPFMASHPICLLGFYIHNSRGLEYHDILYFLLDTYDYPICVLCIVTFVLPPITMEKVSFVVEALLKIFLRAKSSSDLIQL